MKIWILGANGQVGKALKALCVERSIEHLASSKEEIDICQMQKLEQGGEGCTHLINCAAYTDVDGAEKNPEQAFAVNSVGCENVARVALKKGMKVVHISTDYVFAGDASTPYTEEDLPNPLGVYGKSKWEGEQRLLAKLPTACIVRTSWVFGESGKNYLSSLLCRLQTEKSLEVVQEQINRATYVAELAKALIELKDHMGIFHFANSEPKSRFDLAKDFYEEAKKRKLKLACQEILPFSSPSFSAIRPKASVLETAKIFLALGRKPRLWDTVLKEYFDYVQKSF